MMTIEQILGHGDGVLLSVFSALLLMSILSWAVIIARLARQTVIVRGNHRFVRQFWNAPNLDEARHLAQNSNAPLARLVMAATTVLAHVRTHRPQRLEEAVSTDEFLVRTLRNALNRENARTQAGMTLLASVGSSAPFVGLFGTVWGLYHALMQISASGNASIDVVAGPLGEALIATAAGLAAAIPAVLAFNAFTRYNRVLAEELDGFAHDLHAFLTTGAILHGAHK
jgi:biopolymer transport protein ExbB